MTLDRHHREYWEALIAWTQTPEFSSRTRDLGTRIDSGEAVTMEDAAAFLGLPLDLFLDALAHQIRRRSTEVPVTVN